ncbi:MAG TPA: cell filamentation protein Fic, partial [Gammaproteobacteria bacterium]|nr:cell filamentation protein Fic [Gammaproteobacteria bacterium]
KKVNTKTYLKQVAATYVTDAYHSLSIEGYYVSPELIERVRSGKWNPDADENDREHVAALAARGYWQAFQSVEKSLQKVLDGENPGKVFYKDHGDWYRDMFSPSVTAGILKSDELAGYRRHPVYIRGSH